MSEPSRQPEAWLRGPIDGIDPVLMPVAHALVQAREDVVHLASSVPAAHVWKRVGQAASVGFHLRHLAGATDRLLTYARGETLSDAQKAALRAEGAPPDPPPLLREIASDVTATIDRALDQLTRTPPAELSQPRAVGRSAQSTVAGLLFHAAEHATRHVGQAITTARILAGLDPAGS